MKRFKSLAGAARWLALALVCAFVLAGCGSTRVLQPVSAPGGNNALVYFIRKDYPPYLYAARLIVNGTALATVSNNDVVAVNVPVGSNSILVDITDGRELAFELEVREPGTMYVVLTGDVSTAGQRASYEGVSVFLNWRLWAYQVKRPEAESMTAGFRRPIQ